LDNKATDTASLLSCLRSREVYRIESLHLLGHVVTPVLLQDTIKPTLCNCTNISYVTFEFMEIARKL